MRNKQYNIKVYDFQRNYITTLKPNIVRNEPSFTSQINGGYGECRLDLALPFDDFGEGTVVNYMNIVEIYAITSFEPTGVLIYTGYISRYEPYIESSNQGVSVTLLGMVSLLQNAYYKDGSNFTVAHTAEDSADIMKAIIDHFISIYGTGLVSYNGSSIDNVGNSITYTFTDKKWLDAIKETHGTAGPGWWYFFDKEGKLLFKPKPSTPTHTFTLAKDVERLTTPKSIEEVINSTQVRYGDNSVDYSQSSIYGLRESIVSLNGAQNEDTAEKRAEQEVLDNENPKTEATLVINSTYDLESIRVGDTCRILNLKKGSTVLSDNLQIVSVQYTPDRCTLQLESVRSFGRELQKFIS